MKNRKGFTMVELLAVIVILGVLSTIAIISVSKVLNDAKNKYYNSEEDNVLLAAQSYGQNNRDVLPKGIGQLKKIPLSELKKNNYLTEDILSYSKKKCNMETSYVQIFKYSQKDYSYFTFLDCSPEYTSKAKLEEKTPKIDKPEFTPNSEDIRNAKVKVTIHGNDKVLGYSYILSYKSLKDGAKWREVKNSGSLNGNLKEKITFTIKLKDYVPGTVRLEVSATNNYGQTASITADKKYNDTLGPKCVYLNEKDEYKEEDKEHYSWITQTGVNRKMKVQCDDENGVGCAKKEYTKTFKEDADMGTITIKDKLGNETACPMSVYIDRTAPTLTVTAYVRTSSGKNSTSAGSVTANNSKRTVNFTAATHKNNHKDWLNQENYPYGVYYEIIYNENVRINTKQWSKNLANLKKDNSQVNNLTPGAIEQLTKNSGKLNTYLSDEGYRLGKYAITDEAGNTSTVNITAPIDRTNPEIPSITNPTNGNWVNEPFSLTLRSSDTMSGLDNFSYKYAATSWKEYPNSNYSPFETTPFTKDRDELVYLRACDVAGNCSNSSNTRIRLDQTPPTCNTTSSHEGWTNQSVTLTGTCSDETSKCVEEKIKREFTSEIYSDESPGTVRDNAGNTTVCPRKLVRIDQTPPTCKNTGGSEEWQNKDVTIKGLCTDEGGSKCAKDATRTFSGNNNLKNQSPGSVSDNAGNTTICDADRTIKIDVDKPICGETTGDGTKWKQSRKITVACKDDYSGCQASSYSETFDETATTGKITILDKANNKRECPVNVYVDATKPKCGSTSGESTSWKKGSRKITQNCTDADSGCSQASYTTTFSTTTETGKIEISDNAGNTKKCSVKVYVDNTAPTVNISKVHDYEGKKRCPDHPDVVYFQVTTAQALDAHSGIGTVRYTWPKGSEIAPCSGTNTFSTNIYGTRKDDAQSLCGCDGAVSYTVCDYVGNCNSGSR